MINGMSMDQETYQILGHFSLNVLYWKKKLQKDLCGPGEMNEKTADILARSLWPEI